MREWGFLNPCTQLSISYYLQLEKKRNGDKFVFFYGPFNYCYSVCFYQSKEIYFHLLAHLHTNSMYKEILLNSVWKFLWIYTWKITQNFAKECSLKERRNSFKKLTLNLWWISSKTSTEYGNVIKATNFKSFLFLSYKNI